MPSPYTLEDAHGWIALSAVERERGTGLHLVGLRASGEEIVGAAALRVVEQHGDIGYWVAADARRGGVASRAVELLTQFALGTLSLPHVEIVVSPENEASLAVARRCGYSEERRELREFKGKLAEFAILRRNAAGP